MSDRYWIGGTATWDATTTSVWSTTSGGSGGASVPTSSDNVFFDQAGTFTVTIGSSSVSCRSFTVSASTYTFTATAGAVIAYGDVYFVSGTVYPFNLFINGTSGFTLTTNGVVLPNIVTGTNSNYTLGSALTLTNNFLGGSGSILNTSGYTVTATGLSTRFLNMSTSQITLSGNLSNLLTLTWSPGANITFTSNGTTSLTSSAGVDYPSVTFTGSSTVTINKNNTFNNLSSTYVGAKTFQFTAGTTNTFVAFNLRGTSGNLYTITSTTTSPATLTKAGNWYMGANSTNGGGNTGLTFTDGSGIDYLNVSNITGVAIPVQGNFLGLL
jgi:hypothetical protein